MGEVNKMTERMTELLKMSVKHFENCSNPFATEVLAEHDVTSDECYNLSQAIAQAIKFWLEIPKDVKRNLLVKLFIKESDLPDDAKQILLNGLKVKLAHEKVKEDLAKL